MTLNMGIECGSLHTSTMRPDEFVIFGGNTKNGGSRDSYSHNLLDQSSQLVGSMKTRRVL